MIFNKKNKNKKKCLYCNHAVEKKQNFCSACGEPLSSIKKRKKDFGLLGEKDSLELEDSPQISNFGITDKLINSIFSSLMKNLDKQFKNQLKNIDHQENPEIKNFPNGIKIKISGPNPIKQNHKINSPKHRTIKTINQEQLKKMSHLPREKAKTLVKRLGDRIVYELSAPGIDSPEDVFISKLESGYEIKAIGTKKIYVNSVPISLPLKGLSITKSKLLIEFSGQEN